MEKKFVFEEKYEAEKPEEKELIEEENPEEKDQVMQVKPEVKEEEDLFVEEKP